MTDDGGRPLDAREQHEFDAILTGYRRTARRPGHALAPAQVAAVLGAALLVAVLTALLPTPLNLWAPVAVLAIVALLALVRGVTTAPTR